jgi:hypothetical protein
VLLRVGQGPVLGQLGAELGVEVHHVGWLAGGNGGEHLAFGLGPGQVGPLHLHAGVGRFEAGDQPLHVGVVEGRQLHGPQLQTPRACRLGAQTHAHAAGRRSGACSQDQAAAQHRSDFSMQTSFGTSLVRPGNPVLIWTT